MTSLHMVENYTNYKKNNTDTYNNNNDYKIFIILYVK